MEEAAALIGLEAATFALLCASGIGLASRLADDSPARLAFAPALGVAVLCCFTVSAQWVLPSRYYAWPLSAAIVAASISAAAQAARRATLTAEQLREAPWLLLAALWGLSLSALPYIRARTAGPINLQFMDAWFYVPIDRWFQDHALRDDIGNFAVATESVVRAMQELNIRIGFDTLNSTVASLTTAEPDLTLAPVTNALFAAVPVTAYGAARTLAGLGRPASLVAAFFAGSSALLTLPFDSSGPNMAGVVLVAAASLVGLRAITSGARSDVLATGVLVGGLVAIYTELVPMLAVASLVAAGVAVLKHARAPISLLHATPRVMVRVLAIVAIAIAANPIGTARAVRYLGFLQGIETEPAYDRGLSLTTAPGWLFGVVHLYELPRYHLFSDLKLGLAVGFASVLCLLALLGVALGPYRLRLWLLAGLISSLVFAGWTQYGLEWNYGAHRSMTALVPFAAVALAMGVVLAQGHERQRARVPLMLVLVLAGALAVRSEWSLARALEGARTDFEAGTREIRPSLERFAESGEPVLVEGAGAGYPGDLFFDSPALVDQVGSAGVRPIFEPGINHGIVGGGLLGRQPDASYSPDYELVVTRFGGVSSDRVMVHEAGPYTVLRRARIDVAVVGTGWGVDEDTPGHEAFPWLREDFELWISAPDAARAELRLLFVGTDVDTARVALSRIPSRQLPLSEHRREGELVLCTTLQLADGLNRVAVVPALDPRPAPVVALHPDVSPPAIERRLGLNGVFVSETSTGCARG